jgi:hypothetical protein
MAIDEALVLLHLGTQLIFDHLAAVSALLASFVEHVHDLDLVGETLNASHALLIDLIVLE